MWLTEIMGRICGEPVNLQNDLHTEWACDPHAKVELTLPQSYTAHCELYIGALSAQWL